MVYDPRTYHILLNLRHPYFTLTLNDGESDLVTGVFLPLTGPAILGKTGTDPGNGPFLLDGGIRLGGITFGIASFAIPLCTRCIAYRYREREEL